MNLHDAATHIPLSHERLHETDTRLHGRWLLLARIVWLVLAVLTLSVYLASLPDYFVQLQLVCRLAVCSYGQLSPDTVVALQHFGLSVGSYAAFRFTLATILALVFFGTGGVIFWRKSDDWMALLFALMLVVGGTFSVIETVGPSHSAWWLPIWLLAVLLIFLFFLAFTLFPDGRFVPRWTRWLLVVMSILSVILVVKEFSSNPLLAPLWIGVPITLLSYSLFASLAIAQIYRYRYISSLVQRQQTKWVLYGLTALVVAYVGGFLPTLNFPRSLYSLVYNLFFTCTTFLIPFTIGIAILRNRLWDIDIIINRTLVYGTLTAILALVYFGLIFALQDLLRGIINQNNDVAIVVSTLAIAALFQPLRHRLQRVIDRSFYRRKYDAAKTVEAFSATLRNEVDLDQLREQLVAVVQETMQPSHVSLWLRPPEPSRKRKTWLLVRMNEEERVEA